MGEGTSFFLQIVENPDGSVTRPPVPLSPPAGEHQDSPVHSKDVPLNPALNTSIRIYRPNTPPPPGKLPVVLYFHGGGFVVFPNSSIFYHQFCERLALSLPALVLSLDYRLAPEHRLPAAYHDAAEALLWARAADDPWLATHGDLSRFFVMGSSSGANMAYHMALRLEDGPNLEPLVLNGLVLNQPFFGGVDRAPSEAALEEDAVIPLRANDMLWRLALPEGADRSHEFCDPSARRGSLRLPKCLLRGSEGDPLFDRQRWFAEQLEAAGVSVAARLGGKRIHAAELFDPAEAVALIDDVRDFICG